MTPALNLDYQLIYRKEETEQLFFKNILFGNLLQLSEAEYEILQAYVRHADYAATAAQFAEEFEFGPEFIPQLVDRARSAEFLLTPEYLARKEAEQAKHPGRFHDYVNYLTFWISQVLAPLRIQLKPELRGNFRFYRVLAIDFQGSWFDRLCSARWGQGLVLACWLLLLGWAGLGLWHTGLRELAPHRLLAIAPAGGRYVSLLILAGVLLTTFIHEMGHFLVYRYYGGQTSEMGLALTLGVFPVLYVTTNSLYLWDKQRHRLAVTAAGLLVDVGQVILFMALLTHKLSPGLSFYSVVFLYLALVRIVANSNPFIPGSDGYFLATDVLARPALYQSATMAADKALRQLRVLAFGQITRPQWLGLLYMLTSVICITLYYTFLGSTLLLPIIGILY